MERWVDHTAMVVDSQVQAVPQSDLEDIAYAVYRKHTLLGELVQAVPLSEHSRAALEATFNRNLKKVGKESNTVWKLQRHNAAYRAHPKDQRVADATERQHKLLRREGLGYRFSLTCMSLLVQTDDGASLSKQRMQSIGRGHRAMLRAAATWSNSEPTAIASKAMLPETARAGTDHGVLYGRGRLTPAETLQKAEQYSRILHQPSRDHVPLGMEPAADGVAYAEVHEHRRGRLGTTHLPPGCKSSDSKGSYGDSRAKVVAEAIRRGQQRRGTDESLRQRATEELDGALRQYGYDKDNPARAAPTKAQGMDVMGLLKKLFGWG